MNISSYHSVQTSLQPQNSAHVCFFALADVLAAKGATAKSQPDVMQARLNDRLAHAKLTSAIGK